MKRRGGNFKADALGLPSPLQRWVKVRIVSVGPLRLPLVGLRRDQAHRRVVYPLLVGMAVLLDRALPALSCFSFCRISHLLLDVSQILEPIHESLGAYVVFAR